MCFYWYYVYLCKTHHSSSSFPLEDSLAYIMQLYTPYLLNTTILTSHNRKSESYWKMYVLSHLNNVITSIKWNYHLYQRLLCNITIVFISTILSSFSYINHYFNWTSCTEIVTLSQVLVWNCEEENRCLMSLHNCPQKYILIIKSTNRNRPPFPITHTQHTQHFFLLCYVMNHFH